MNKYSRQPGDSILALLEPGEYVLNRNAVNEIGKENLDDLNYEDAPRFDMSQRGQFQVGGMLGDMDRGNLKSLLGLVQGATGTQESRIAKGRSYDLSPYQKLMSDEQNMMVNQINDLRNKNYFTKKREKDFISQYDSKWQEPLDIGMQMGGMMPGGVSNALPYNIGGSVQQQPMAYQLGGLLKYRRSPMMG